MKARILWLVKGDRNTSFYHTSALVRRKRNRILCMKDRVGNQLNGEREIVEFIRQGFLDLFTSGHISAPLAEWDHPSWNTYLNEEALTILGTPITNKEITEGLWALKPFEALGPNSLHAGFFHRFQLIVGESIRKDVKNIFNSRVIPKYLNQTLITLISKCRSPKSLFNFRPISLWNTTYKIETKIIVGRIRPFLPGLISPLQSAFVPGRKGLDNAIIVQEIIHTMSKKKGKTGYMAIKFDLEKAYNRLECNFIRDTLKLFQFPNHLVSLIMSCVSNSSISILFNGGTLDAFHSLRGIRQGDPLSPYLFILCMEVLGALFEGKCRENLWNPLKASQGGPAFSHLFFANDLMLFAKADGKNCVAIKDVLDSFCDLSGQKVSGEKTHVFFSPNVDQRMRNDLCNVLGFRSTSSLGKYLGFPIKHREVHQDFSFILERIQNKLAGWKANLLSLAMRVILT